MIIYKPYGKAKPHPMRDEVKKLYQKYKDEIELGATAEFPAEGLKSFVGTLHKVFALVFTRELERGNPLSSKEVQRYKPLNNAQMVVIVKMISK